MKKITAQIRCTAIVICLTATTVSSIEKETVIAGSAVSGAAAAATTFWLGNIQTNFNKKYAAPAAAIVGFLTTAITYHLLSQHTPEAKIAAVIAHCTDISQELTNIEKDDLVHQKISTPEELLTAVTHRFGNEWPLVLAHEHIIKLSQRLINVSLDLLNTDQALKKDPECKKFFDGLEARIQQIDLCINAVRNLITTHPNRQEHIAHYKGAKYSDTCNKIVLALKNVDHDFLIDGNVSAPEDLLARVTTGFGTHWPLIFAREHLVILARKLDDATNDLITADSLYQGLQQDPVCKDFFKDCSELEKAIQAARKKIDAMQKIIVTHPTYATQIQLFENNEQYNQEAKVKQQNATIDQQSITIKQLEATIRQLELDYQTLLINTEKQTKKYQLQLNDQAQQVSLREKDYQKQIKTLLDALEKQRKELQALKERQSTPDKPMYIGEMCVICQEAYKPGDAVSVLNCNHAFHNDCIKTNMQYSKACPLCRATDMHIKAQELVK